MRWMPMALMMAGCASSGVSPVARIEEQRVLASTPRRIDLTRSPESVREDIALAKLVLKKRKGFDAKDLERVEAIIDLYRSGKTLAVGDELTLLPNSQTHIEVDSFCLDPELSIPAENELFSWRSTDAGILYLHELLGLAASNESPGQEIIQELIWNLVNETSFESYPPRLQAVLKKIDPQAPWRLPSEAKTKFKREAGEIVRRVAPPELGQVVDGINLVRGRYYDYGEIVSKLKTANPLDGEQAGLLTNDPEDPALYLSVSGEGFKKRTLGFYNPEGKAKKLKLKGRVLVPGRSSVQRLGVSVRERRYEAIPRLIEEGIGNSIADEMRYWGGRDLTAGERRFIEKYPFDAWDAYVQSQWAVLATRKYFGRSDEDDESDAFRHFVWAGLLVERMGEHKARELLEAHEEIIGAATDKQLRSRRMDRFNNERGVQAGLRLKESGKLSREALEKAGFEEVRTGTLHVIDKHGHRWPYPSGND